MVDQASKQCKHTSSRTGKAQLVYLFAGFQCLLFLETMPPKADMLRILPRLTSFVEVHLINGCHV